MDINAFDFPASLIEQLRSARHIVVLTGAGISAESGIPTFRDALSGLWSNFKPEELATPEAFLRNPKMVWEWYAWRREQVGTVQPNPGHVALAEIERHVPSFTLITQNVDGLHRRAGSQHVLELHGNIARTRCFDENIVIEQWEDTGDVPPHCPRCAGLLRPDVVWFGENLPEEVFAEAVDATRNSDLFFSIGTSGLVEPAASLSYLAHISRAQVTVINPDRDSVPSFADYALIGPAGSILPALVRCAWPDQHELL